MSPFEFNVTVDPMSPFEFNVTVEPPAPQPPVIVVPLPYGGPDEDKASVWNRTALRRWVMHLSLQEAEQLHASLGAAIRSAGGVATTDTDEPSDKVAGLSRMELLTARRRLMAFRDSRGQIIAPRGLAVAAAIDAIDRVLDSRSLLGETP